MNACLTPVVSMHGYAVTTVEGIGSTKTKLHAVQVNARQLENIIMAENAYELKSWYDRINRSVGRAVTR